MCNVICEISIFPFTATNSNHRNVATMYKILDKEKHKHCNHLKQLLALHANLNTSFTAVLPSNRPKNWSLKKCLRPSGSNPIVDSIYK